jgi:NAD(P)-dependent dehydrogenase (short-subunit alcohol dehydrogenase family)
MPVEPGREYAGRRAVVTGCASGIGQALVHVLRERGATVVGLDRAEPTAPVDTFHQLDLGDSAAIAAVAAAIGEPVDALFNVAGVSGPIGAGIVVGINFVGLRELTEALLPRMRPGSAVVHTASLAASRYAERRELVAELLATPDRAAALAWVHAHPDEVGTGYALSKDAIVWYTLTTALEQAHRGVRVNCLAPGTTETPIIEATRRARGDAFLDAIPMPLGRLAQPREQAEVLAFLGSPAASYVCGQVLWADGGYLGAVAAGQLEMATGSVGPATPDPT